MTFVSEHLQFNLPVGETGAERKGNVLMYRLKHLQDEGITS